MIEDLKAINGVFVNGERIFGSSQVLNDGDIIQLGGLGGVGIGEILTCIKFIFHVEEANRAAKRKRSPLNGAPESSLPPSASTVKAERVEVHNSQEAALQKQQNFHHCLRT